MIGKLWFWLLNGIMLHMLAHSVHAAAPFKQTHDQRERTQRDYNKINAIDYDAYASFAAVHLSGMRTNRNLLVGVYEEACKADVRTALDFFPSEIETTCPRGHVYESLSPVALPHPHSRRSA